MGWTGDGHMVGLMGWWWIIVLAAIVAVVWFAAAAGRGRGPGEVSAEQQLKKHYAAGEIDDGIFRRMLQDPRR